MMGYENDVAHSSTRWGYAEIADVCAEVVSGCKFKSLAGKYGVSQERVRQVYAKGIRLMVSPKHLDEPLPEHDRYLVREVRAHSTFWMRRIAKLRSAA